MLTPYLLQNIGEQTECKQILKAFSKVKTQTIQLNFIDYGSQSIEVLVQMSCVMRKPAFCICENKDTDQLRSNGEADQGLCFHYTDSTIPLVSKSEISSR